MHSLHFSLVYTFILGCYGLEDAPLVETPLGVARGFYKTSYAGRQFSAFEGLPYAKPPVGTRRFEEPEPVEPWIGIWNATSTSICAQTDLMQPNKTQGTEDCLHINVYVPRRELDSEEKLDVIVHIHGGAFVYGSGGSYIEPDLLMDREVIFVNFNYRLGIFGFLSTEDDVVPGNNGLKDQTMALKWVKTNIASFGGNPDSVTITGLSAGGASVHLHYFTDLSKGLFHRGFSQSGVALNPWAIQEEPLMRAKKLAAGVGCPTTNTRILVACLKQRPYLQLLEQMQNFFIYFPLPIVPFGPCVEKAGDNPFLKNDPYQLLKKGQVVDVPYIASVSAHEGLLPVMFFLNDMDTIEDKWDQLAPHFLEYNHTVSKSEWISFARTIKDHYLGQEKISKENYLKLVDLFTDRYFATDAGLGITMQAKVTKSPVYLYLFGYPGDNNPEKTVNHCADGKYIYTNAFGQQPLTENELVMSKLLVDMLIEFSRTGKAAISGVDWPASKSDTLTYLKINGIEDGEIVLETTDNFAQRKFWEQFQLDGRENLDSKRDEL